MSYRKKKIKKLYKSLVELIYYNMRLDEYKKKRFMVTCKL